MLMTLVAQWVMDDSGLVGMGAGVASAAAAAVVRAGVTARMTMTTTTSVMTSTVITSTVMMWRWHSIQSWRQLSVCHPELLLLLLLLLVVVMWTAASLYLRLHPHAPCITIIGSSSCMIRPREVLHAVHRHHHQQQQQQ
jgi:hypothetical protein